MYFIYTYLYLYENKHALNIFFHVELDQRSRFYVRSVSRSEPILCETDLDRKTTLFRFGSDHNTNQCWIQKPAGCSPIEKDPGFTKKELLIKGTWGLLLQISEVSKFLFIYLVSFDSIPLKQGPFGYWNQMLPKSQTT